MKTNLETKVKMQETREETEKVKPDARFKHLESIIVFRIPDKNQHRTNHQNAYNIGKTQIRELQNQPEDGDGEWLGDTDGVGDLNQDASAESGLDEGFGDPAGGVGGGTIHFGEVLAGESATTVGAPSSVSVDDDLTACQTGVSHGTADDEFAGRLN